MTFNDNVEFGEEAKAEIEGCALRRFVVAWSERRVYEVV
jgi:hypothetical protein